MTRQLRSAPTPRSATVVRRAAHGPPARSLVLPRAAARAIDAAVVLAPAALIGLLSGRTLGAAFVVLVLLAVYLYETIAVARLGTTIGKAALGLEVVDVDLGDRPRLSRAGTRILFVVAAAAAVHLVVPLGPAVAVFLWGSATTAADGRGLPDRVADTVVVRRR